MKILHLIVKSLKEQIRSYWVLLLTVSMGPFFIFIYFLITEGSKTQYKILIENEDEGISDQGKEINYGNVIALFLIEEKPDSVITPFIAEMVTDRGEGIERVKNKKADALIVIDRHFSSSVAGVKGDSPRIEFIGDLTSTRYLLSALWASEIITRYVTEYSGTKSILEVSETALGVSGSMDDFEMLVPGILILSLIMLMFTASIAFVSEIENKTIMRLRLSRLTAFEFLCGISVVQLLVGIISILLTLATAVLLGFRFSGSIPVMLLIGGLTSISIISFSLIIAAATKSANEVLVAGNFPMFLFMFFTGAAFPLSSEPWFTIGDYPVSIQGLMSPTHAISALNKTLVMNMKISDIIPEMTALIILSVLYFIIGALLFRNRHLKLSK